MSTDEGLQPARRTLSDNMRLRFKGVLDPIAGFLLNLGLKPNTITLAGLAGNAIGAFFLARGDFLVGGLLVLIMGPIDALDGAMARLRGEASDFGAFVDSVTDRYSELFIYAGLLVTFVVTGRSAMVILTFIAAAGSVLVSYVKARAESLDFEARGGMLTRLERYLVLAPALVLTGFGVALAAPIGVGLIAVLANVTALQRIRAVRQQARRRM
jgi:CDP-diacylglycerol--glycerol-3-phosphate 3-phosphatidyltransferase